MLYDEDVYLPELVCYIHLNSLRAGIVPLNSYPCTGHTALMGKHLPRCQDTDKVLRLFGSQKYR